MATEYEGVDLHELAKGVERYVAEHEDEYDCATLYINAETDTVDGRMLPVIRGVLARLQADGRLITGEVEKQYGILVRSTRRPYEWIEDAGAIGTWTRARAERAKVEVMASPMTESVEVVYRTAMTGAWLPVSDIGNDQDQEKP